MKVLIALKRVIHPDRKISLCAQGKIVAQDIIMGMNPFDERAIEQAVRWKAHNQVTEIVIVSIGSLEVCETLHVGLAQGADRAILWSTQESLESLHIAQLLALTIEQESPDIVLMGQQAIDEEGAQIGPMVAGMLNWPQGSFASKVELKSDKQVLVTQENEEGLETLRLEMPCLITVGLELNEPQVLSLFSIMHAQSKSIDIRDLPVSFKISSHTKVLKRDLLCVKRRPIQVNSVKELIHYLQDIEKLI